MKNGIVYHTIFLHPFLFDYLEETLTSVQIGGPGWLNELGH